MNTQEAIKKLKSRGWRVRRCDNNNGNTSDKASFVVVKKGSWLGYLDEAGMRYNSRELIKLASVLNDTLPRFAKLKSRRALRRKLSYNHDDKASFRELAKYDREKFS